MIIIAFEVKITDYGRMVSRFQIIHGQNHNPKSNVYFHKMYDMLWFFCRKNSWLMQNQGLGSQWQKLPWKCCLKHPKNSTISSANLHKYLEYVGKKVYWVSVVRDYHRIRVKTVRVCTTLWQWYRQGRAGIRIWILLSSFLWGQRNVWN